MSSPEHSPEPKRAGRREPKQYAVDVDRLPPHSIEAEQGVLGCLLQEPKEAIPAAVARLRQAAQAFYDLRHQTLYAALVEMDRAGLGIDLVTVRQWLKDRGQLEQLGDVAYLTALVDSTPSAANLPFYADIVAEKAALRALLKACANGIGRIHDEELGGNVDALMADVEKDLMAALSARDEADARDLTAKEAVGEALEYLETFVRGKGMNVGLSTGFAFFDKMTAGLHPEQMIVVAGRPGTGKTSWLKAVLEHLCVNLKVPAGMFSLEMSARQIASHIMFRKAGVNFQNARTGMMRNDDIARLTVASAAVAAAPLHIDDRSNLTMQQIRSRARKWVKKDGVKLLAVDYMQLIRLPETARYQDRQQEVSRISSDLKALAKELKVPVIVLAQLNRDIEKDTRGGEVTHNRKPQLADLRESGAIEQDADLVMIFYTPKLREERRDKETSEVSGYDEADHLQQLTQARLGDMGDTEAANWSGGFKRVNGAICKQREGPQADVEFTFFGPTMSFEDYLRPGSSAARYVKRADGEAAPRHTAADMPTEREMNL